MGSFIPKKGGGRRGEVAIEIWHLCLLGLAGLGLGLLRSPGMPPALVPRLSRRGKEKPFFANFHISPFDLKMSQEKQL